MVSSTLGLGGGALGFGGTLVPGGVRGLSSGGGVSGLSAGGGVSGSSIFGPLPGLGGGATLPPPGGGGGAGLSTVGLLTGGCVVLVPRVSLLYLQINRYKRVISLVD